MNSGIIYDWSGTLSDSFHNFLAVYNLMMEEYGKPKRSPKQIRNAFSTPYINFWSEALPGVDIVEIRQRYIHHLEKLPKPRLFKGIYGLLEQMSAAKYVQFIVSSDRYSTLLPEVDLNGVGTLMAQIIGDVHRKDIKLQAIISSYYLDRRHSFIVGDADGDIEAGRNAGLRTIGVAWGYSTEERLKSAGADMIAHNTDELRDCLLNHR